MLSSTCHERLVISVEVSGFPCAALHALFLGLSMPSSLLFSFPAIFGIPSSSSSSYPCFHIHGFILLLYAFFLYIDLVLCLGASSDRVPFVPYQAGFFICFTSFRPSCVGTVASPTAHVCYFLLFSFKHVPLSICS